MSAPARTRAFDARYRADPDPWGTLTDPYEQRKRRQTLDACGPGPFAAAVDLGAGLGALAVELAPRCRALLALDASPTAVAAARRRLAHLPQAQARVAVLPDDLPPVPFDLVVASEILYYLDRPALDAVLGWLRMALVPGGRVVAVHWTGTADDLHRDADAVGQALAATPDLTPTLVRRGGGFRLDVLQREGRGP